MLAPPTETESGRSGLRTLPAVLCLLTLLALSTTRPRCAAAQGSAELGNWFDDPFFQVSAAVPGCALPAGPFTTEADKRLQIHHRAEEGTSCWLAGRCKRPNAYLYDRDIARALRARLAGSPVLDGTSLWVTVQGRKVFIAGCVSDAGTGPRLEALAQAVPDVELAVALVSVGAAQRPPYRLRHPQVPR